MKISIFNTHRKSELSPLIYNYYEDLQAQLVMGVIRSGIGTTKSTHIFEGVGNDEIDINTRVQFLNSTLAKVELYPVFIFAKKGFELNEVFEGLPYQTITEADESGADMTRKRTFAEWHLPGNTSIIRGTEEFILIRTAVLNQELSDQELQVLKDQAYLDPTTPKFTMLESSIAEMTTNDFILWGMKELKQYQDTYFPSV